jgi:hypothetical protein
MAVINLPSCSIRTVGDTMVFEAGNPVRHDPSGANVSFRPMAEKGIDRLASSLLLTENEIHTTAEWISAGSDEGRAERLAAMLATRAGVAVDWVERALKRHESRVLKAQTAGKKATAI